MKAEHDKSSARYPIRIFNGNTERALTVVDAVDFHAELGAAISEAIRSSTPTKHDHSGPDWRYTCQECNRIAGL